MPGPSGSVLRLLLVAGARLNEIAQLRWEEVSDDFATLTIPGERTKNSRALIVPLPPMARQLVAAQDRNGPFVFSTTGGITPASAAGRMAKERLDAAMGNVPAWVIHDLRRTAATHMAEIGIQPHIIEAVLNHVSGHQCWSCRNLQSGGLQPPRKKTALEQWADHIQSIVQSIVDDKKVVAIRGGR